MFQMDMQPNHIPVKYGMRIGMTEFILFMTLERLKKQKLIEVHQVQNSSTKS